MLLVKVMAFSLRDVFRLTLAFIFFSETIRVKTSSWCWVYFIFILSESLKPWKTFNLLISLSIALSRSSISLLINQLYSFHKSRLLPSFPRRHSRQPFSRVFKRIIIPSSFLLTHQPPLISLSIFHLIILILLWPKSALPLFLLFLDPPGLILFPQPPIKHFFLPNSL